MEKLFEKQGLHLAAVAVLVVVLYCIYSFVDGFSGEFLGISTGAWFWGAVITAVIHQVYVWAVWRVELEFKWVTKNYPESGFRAYALFFFLLFAARIAAVFLAAVSNSGSFPIYDAVKWPLVVLFSLLVIWLFYSVKKYFGFKRATGADHFYPEYREMPLVKEGIFKYTNNGMYGCGFLIFWLFAVLFESKAALLLAGFNHIYIWVHFYCTELPDMKRIYD